MRRDITILLFLLFSFRAFSQGSGVKFDRISVREGLADHSINCITQDHLGFVWIGGESGLYRYDGYEFSPIACRLRQTTALALNSLS